MISFSENFNQFKDKFKEYFQIKGQHKGVQELEEEDKFCSPEEKSKMREVYFLLRKCENLDIKCIVIGWEGDQSGTIWDKIFRSTQGNFAIFS